MPSADLELGGSFLGGVGLGEWARFFEGRAEVWGFGFGEVRGRSWELVLRVFEGGLRVVVLFSKLQMRPWRLREACQRLR